MFAALRAAYMLVRRTEPANKTKEWAEPTRRTVRESGRWNAFLDELGERPVHASGAHTMLATHFQRVKTRSLSCGM